MPPLVTVLVGCYNHEAYIEQCLDSVAAQTWKRVEIVIHDDASSDRSRLVIDDWAARHDTRPIRVYPPRNGGICAALNRSLCVARGEFVVILSADDVLLPGHVAALVGALADRPQAAVAYGDAVLVDQEGRPYGDTFIERFLEGDAPNGSVFHEILARGSVPGMAALVRRAAIHAVGGYDESIYFEDWDMWLRLADRYEFVYVPEVVCHYRTVETSMSRTAGERAALSFFRSSEKWLERDAQSAAIARAKLKKYARQIYGCGPGIGRSELWRNVRYNPGVGSLTMAVGSTLGIRHEQLERLVPG